MQKRASDRDIVKSKYWDEEKGEELDEEEVSKIRDFEAAAAKNDDNLAPSNNGNNNKKKQSASQPIQEIPYSTNSVSATTVFCILIRPVARNAPKTVRRTLSTLRLRKVHEGIFLRYTPQTRKMLHLVEPYVLYGIPGVETVADLVRRRGFCKIDGKRVQISDNNVVEENLGDIGLICVEDLIAVLTTDGDEEVFGKVSKFLWPFRMSSRKSKFQKRMLDLKDGKLYGDQGEVMNGYIREML